MSSDGYIYVKNWRKYQHGTAGLPWHKVYGALLHDDAYCELTLADRGTLHGIWMLASLTGDGRVSASRTYLARHLNVRRVSLESLIQAGWIEIRLDKAESKASTELEEEEKEIQVQPAVVPVAATPSPRPRNEQWDTLVEVFGYTPAQKTEQSLWGKLTKQLRECGATHDTIVESAERYAVDMPGATFTPTGLAKNYQRLMAPTWHPPATTRNGRGGAGDTIHLMQLEQRRQLGTP